MGASKSRTHNGSKAKFEQVRYTVALGAKRKYRWQIGEQLHLIDPPHHVADRRPRDCSLRPRAPHFSSRDRALVQVTAQTVPAFEHHRHSVNQPLAEITICTLLPSGVSGSPVTPVS
jgi:hypothetical protein